MCVVSMIGDHYGGVWPTQFPTAWPTVTPNTIPAQNISDTLDLIQIKKELAELKVEFAKVLELLKKAKIYDERNNEPNCEMDEKVAIFKKLAEIFGLDISHIFPVAD